MVHNGKLVGLNGVDDAFHVRSGEFTEKRRRKQPCKGLGHHDAVSARTLKASA